MGAFQFGPTTAESGLEEWRRKEKHLFMSPKGCTLDNNFDRSRKSAALGESLVNIDSLVVVVCAEFGHDIICFTFLEQPWW
jgi:hypothetical protein